MPGHGDQNDHLQCCTEASCISTWDPTENTQSEFNREETQTQTESHCICKRERKGTVFFKNAIVLRDKEKLENVPG